MTLTTQSINRFGGLDLLNDPLDVGPERATYLNDVSVDRPGLIRSRDGYDQWNTSTLSASGYSALFPSPTNGGTLIGMRYSAGGNVNLDRFSTAGVATNIGSFASGSGTYSLAQASIGTLTTTSIYIALVIAAGVGVTLRKYDGTTLSTGTGKPLFVATLPTSNRLVQGGYYAAADSPSGVNGSRSTVFFSDAGAPDTYTAANFVTLRPGDGEVITGIVQWRDMVFVFKQSAVFIFYGESVGPTGLPVFNYRRVDLPAYIPDPVQLAPFTTYVTAGPDGVYFSTPAGIYRTAGDSPELFTRPVNRIFSTDPTVPGTIAIDFGITGGLDIQAASLSWAARRLHIGYLNQSFEPRQLVYDTRTDQWTIWSMPTRAFAAYPPVASASASDYIFFPNESSAVNDIYVSGPAYTDDNGTPISWSYKSGQYALEDDGRATITRELAMWGSGTVTAKIANDDGALDAGSAVVLGTSPAVARGWQQIDREGVLWQHELSGSGPGKVQRLTHFPAHTKPAGVE